MAAADSPSKQCLMLPFDGSCKFALQAPSKRCFTVVVLFVDKGHGLLACPTCPDRIEHHKIARKSVIQCDPQAPPNRKWHTGKVGKFGYIKESTGIPNRVS